MRMRCARRLYGKKVIITKWSKDSVALFKFKRIVLKKCITDISTG